MYVQNKFSAFGASMPLNRIGVIVLSTASKRTQKAVY